MDRNPEPAHFDLAATLSAHRRARGLTQEQLADAAGVAVRTIRDLESGAARSPRPSTAHRLAAALGLPPGERAALLDGARTARIVGAGRFQPAADAHPVRSLPRDLPDFVGREAELAALAAATGRTTLITGPPGVGKTSLAVSAAHRLAGPGDSALYAALADDEGRPLPPARVLDPLFLAFGIEPSAWPRTGTDHLAAYRRLTSHHRGVLVLDDLTDPRVAAQLIPASPGWTVLLTARGPVAGSPAADRLPLDAFDEATAVRLLGSVIGTDRLAAEPAAAAELAELCGGLPLAVRLVANRIAARPGWLLRWTADRLRDREHRLARLSAGDLSVATGIASSYRRLTPPVRRALRRLALIAHPDHPESLLVALAEPAARAGVVPAAYESGLVQAGPRPGHFRIHPLVALYLTQQADEEDARAAIAAGT